MHTKEEFVDVTPRWHVFQPLTRLNDCRKHYAAKRLKIELLLRQLELELEADKAPTRAPSLRLHPFQVQKIQNRIKGARKSLEYWDRRIAAIDQKIAAERKAKIFRS